MVSSSIGAMVPLYINGGKGSRVFSICMRKSSSSWNIGDCQQPPIEFSLKKKIALVFHEFMNELFRSMLLQFSWIQGATSLFTWKVWWVQFGRSGVVYLCVQGYNTCARTTKTWGYSQPLQSSSPMSNLSHNLFLLSVTLSPTEGSFMFYVPLCFVAQCLAVATYGACKPSFFLLVQHVHWHVFEKNLCPNNDSSLVDWWQLVRT
jgi:hypothetical protein